MIARLVVTALLAFSTGQSGSAPDSIGLNPDVPPSVRTEVSCSEMVLGQVGWLDVTVSNESPEPITISSPILKVGQGGKRRIFDPWSKADPVVRRIAPG